MRRAPSSHALLRRALVPGALLCAVLLASCAGAPSGRPGVSTASPQAPAAGTTWMLSKSALSAMISVPSLAPRLRGAHVDEILQPGQQPLAGTGATVVVTFSALSSLRAAISGGRLPPAARAVLYDPENWSFTPDDEQRNPVRAATEAARLAHRAGLQLIVAPGLTLTKVLAAGSREPLWQRFLQLRLAASMARVADVLELQAQSLERDADRYASFVRLAAGQARAANPRIALLAGLSTNPPGAVVTARELIAAFAASQSLVSGYWLNIPGQGPHCPACNPRQPAVGAALLSHALPAARP